VKACYLVGMREIRFQVNDNIICQSKSKAPFPSPDNPTWAVILFLPSVKVRWNEEEPRMFDSEIYSLVVKAQSELALATNDRGAWIYVAIRIFGFGCGFSRQSSY
jgi:hypothetical protein